MIIMKRAVLYLLILIGTFSLSACGKPAEVPASDGYILTHYFALPDSITAISGSALDGESVLLCCREEADEDNLAYSPTAQALTSCRLTLPATAFRSI